MDKTIVYKRVFSSMIDIFVATIPIIFLNYFDIINIGISVSFLINFTFICCVIPIISNGQTLGDILLKIRIVSLDTNGTSLLRVIVRNITYDIILTILTSEIEDHVVLISMGVIFLILYAAMFSNKNKYSEFLTTLDLIFKTKYIV